MNFYCFFYLQVFGMLNDLNSMFNSISFSYKVCTVETVKDTFFVVCDFSAQ